jgi:uncharacterized protein
MLGDARSGKFTENLVGFGRALRRAGLKVDSSRMVMASQALQLVGFGSKSDLSAALEAVMVSEKQDREVFRELFDVYFKDPKLANKLLSQLLPSAEGKAQAKGKARVREALAPQKAYGTTKPQGPEKQVDFDAAMTASDEERLRHADFNSLTASEYRLVEALVRDIPMRVPLFKSRRQHVAARGASFHWAASIKGAARHAGELLDLKFRRAQMQPLPVLILVDVSGSMERYARMLMAFLHASLRYSKRKQMFAFGTHLTDLNHAFLQPDTDKMLTGSSALIDDFAGGTKLGDSLAQLRTYHSRSLVGRRTLVLLITDGLDTGDRANLEAELSWLRLHCGKLLWLNPLLRFDGYQPLAQGAAVLAKAVHGSVAVHNVSKLEMLAKSLSILMTKGR